MRANNGTYLHPVAITKYLEMLNSPGDYRLTKSSKRKIKDILDYPDSGFKAI